ncbi:GntR family transcriptional regulator [Arsenicicoccus piscis]|uniref:GntR family transcriptional regulator n=1 Tax=Arsenicicoccus piscis TaxID=673954 RepID=A0ABQ6HS61_9MICO|nr:GntR family transcriptional regulator [Arsenicicoccus piscis]MCH8626440.1 GntR family transcriptional regulator [Arsenicicoccus piscis]GMA21065.1 GntR family transcriptional regulator [Arsenicicoccus piscis]
MDIEVDPLSPVPIYQQIRDRIVEGIGAGHLHRGDALTSVRALASAFAINPATVAKAYELLRSEGLVATNAKSGTFVARDRTGEPPSPQFVEDWTGRAYTLLAEGRARGLSTSSILEVVEQLSARVDAGASSTVLQE